MRRYSVITALWTIIAAVFLYLPHVASAAVCDGTPDIIICGAGHGGLYTAARLAAAGYHVDLFEKNAEEDLGWDWHDNFRYETFQETGITPPPWSDYIRITDFTFVSPDGRHRMTTALPLEKREIAMDRRVLLRMLVRMARESGVHLNFEHAISGPVIDHGVVAGIIVRGEERRAGLVVDSAGIDSPIRRALPSSYGIQSTLGRGERFYVYRAYYSLNRAASFDARLYGVYFGINGMRGIAWIRAIDGACDVLIGSIDRLDTGTVQRTLDVLRKDNPQIGDRIVRGGSFAALPLRRPLDLFVGHNYAAIGDAAAMTVPVIGSGIENTLRAASILADTVIRIGKTSCENGISFHRDDLWDYQYRFYRDAGGRLCGLDRVKYFLLTSDWEDFNRLFAMGLLEPSDLEKPLLGEGIHLAAGDMASRFFRGWYRPDLLFPMKFMLDGADTATKRALEIPRRYSDSEVAEWRARLNACFTRLDRKLAGMR